MMTTYKLPQLSVISVTASPQIRINSKSKFHLNGQIFSAALVLLIAFHHLHSSVFDKSDGTAEPHTHAFTCFSLQHGGEKIELTFSR